MPSFFQNLFKKDPDESAVETPDAPLDRQSEPTSLLSAMNLASPFAPVASEQFTIRELIMLLPPQLVRTESMPGDQPVALPLDLLRGSMQQGRPALRLSQIYMACPFLFTRQVQPAEDLEIVLPFQKVKRMLDGGVAAASPFTAVAPPSRMDSPFAPAGSPFVQNGGPQTAAASPFAVRAPEPAPQNEVLSPFSAEGHAPAQPQNPFQRMEAAPAPPRPATSPFHLVTPAAAHAQPPMPTMPPAGVPVLPMSTPSPFAAAGNGNGKAGTAPVAVRPEAIPLEVNPFESFSPPAPFPVAAEPPPHSPAPVRPEPPVAPVRTPTGCVPAGGEIRVSLLALLRDVTAEDLGFDPTAVPAHVEAVLPLDVVTPQLATGRVEISVEELRYGVEDRFRPAFARAHPGLRFVVPLSEIFRSLPPAAIPAPHAAEHIPISTSPFQTPFALKADEDANGWAPALPPLVAPAPPAPAHPVAQFPIIPSLTADPKPHTAPVALPSAPAPAPAAVVELAAPAPAPPVPFQIPVTAAAAPPAGVAPIKLPGLPSLPKLPGLSARPSPFARPPGMAPAPADPPAGTAPPAAPALPFPSPPVAVTGLPPVESHDDLGHSFSAASLQNEPPAPAPAPVLPSPEPFDPSRLFSAPVASKFPPPFAAPVAPVVAPAPVPAAPRPVPAPVAAAPAAPPIEFNFGETPDMTLVTLRAIFDTDDDLTPHEIVDRLAQLPGIRSAIAILNGGLIASGHASGSEEVALFIASAPKNCEYLTGLAESMGYGRSGSFTMRAGAGVRTIIIENGNCLAVLHDKAGFGPGVRDKLLLTVRLLGELAD